MKVKTDRRMRHVIQYYIQFVCPVYAFVSEWQNEKNKSTLFEIFTSFN